MGEILEIWIEERGNCIVRGRIGGAGFCSPKGCLSDKPRYEQLPKGWSWTRLDNITNIVMGQSPVGDSVTDNAEGVEFHQGKIFFTDRFLAQSGQYTSEGNKIADKNSVLLCVRAPVGIVNITNRKIAIGRGLCALSPLCDMSVEFLFHLLTAFQDSFIEQATGTTFIAITTDVVRQQLVPLPPLAEQRRIVSAIESAFAVIDEIEQNKNDLQSAIAATKQKILSLAIRGKLVKQDPNDEPASVLLERIRAEREKLVSEGKIKRGKGDSAVILSCDNPYYLKLPGSWTVCRLGEVSIVKGGKRVPKGLMLSSTPTDHIYIRVTDMKNNTVLLDNLMYINNTVFEQIRNYTISKDDLYITIAGTIGEVGTIPAILDGMNLTENAAKLTKIIVNRHYLMRTIQSTVVQEQFVEKTTQVSQPKLALERIATTIIPLPPIAEQNRIVTAIESAFEQLDNIAAALM